ncbi:hypothetical protein F4678DRAFT_412941 [Xylaria arbuscula]|nr:hypothetical protein F4678DRAFT_412941 [Xylaria arbuscula]
MPTIAEIFGTVILPLIFIFIIYTACHFLVNLFERWFIRDAEILLRKYQDPLLLAARELQSRLYNILFQGVLHFGNGAPYQQDTLFIYTPFLVGQYFAWLHIQRRRGQSIAFMGDGASLGRTMKLIGITNKMAEFLNTENLEARVQGWEGQGVRLLDFNPLGFRYVELATVGRRDVKRSDVDRRDVERGEAELGDVEGSHAGRPFVLWKDHQRAIGEIMTKWDENRHELTCMDFTEFTNRWKAEDPALHTWFRPISEGIRSLVPVAETTAEANTLQAPIAYRVCTACKAYQLKMRLLGLQHLLVDLVNVLDDKIELGVGGNLMSKGKEQDVDRPHADGSRCY